MKLFNNIVAGTLGISLFLSSCGYHDKFDAPEFGTEILPIATTTLAELKGDYLNNPAHLITKNETSTRYANMFTVYEIPKNTPKIINAVVLSSDEEGNTYQKLVLRDLSDHSALDISIDASGVSSVWPQGQIVSIDCSGLHIGHFANFPTLGFISFNAAPNRLRYEPGRIPYPVALSHIKAIGTPDPALVTPEITTIPQIYEQNEALYSHLVKIKGVRFGYYKTSATNSTPDNFQTNFVAMIDDTNERIPFATENDLNVPVSRVLMDNNGNTISVTTSFYSKFAANELPKGTWDIVAVVGWYRDQERNTGNFQLSVQRFADITPAE